MAEREKGKLLSVYSPFRLLLTHVPNSQRLSKERDNGSNDREILGSRAEG